MIYIFFNTRAMIVRNTYKIKLNIVASIILAEHFHNFKNF